MQLNIKFYYFTHLCGIFELLIKKRFYSYFRIRVWNVMGGLLRIQIPNLWNSL